MSLQNKFQGFLCISLYESNILVSLVLIHQTEKIPPTSGHSEVYLNWRCPDHSAVENQPGPEKWRKYSLYLYFNTFDSYQYVCILNMLITYSSYAVWRDPVTWATVYLSQRLVCKHTSFQSFEYYVCCADCPFSHLMSLPKEEVRGFSWWQETLQAHF